MTNGLTPKSCITRGMVVLGDVVFDGQLTLDGRVCGNVSSRDGASGAVSVLPNGCIEGSLRVRTAIVSGSVHGSVQTTESAIILSEARIGGDVRYSLVEVQLGAQVGGRFVREDSESSGNVVIFKAAAMDGLDGGPL